MRGDSFLDRMASASRDRVSLARARESEAALRALPEDAGIGVAPHSLRAVSPQALSICAALRPDRPLHMHLAEQIPEIEEVSAAYGLRPVPEIQFADYIYPGLDQLISEAARLRYRSAAEYIAPMTVRSPFGGGIFGGQTHSQSPEAIFTHVSGLKTVIPATPYDAKGLLISCIEDNDPVIFFEPKRIYNGPFSGYYDKPVQPWKKFDASVVPEGYYKIPLGKARQVTEGEQLTILAYGTMVHVVEAVCKEKGVEADILDLRTLVPLDIEAIEASVERTGRCLIVHEATRTSGFGAELSALVTERCFYHLEAPVERVTGFDTPYPHSLEWAYFPGPIRIGEAIDKILKD